MASTNKTTHLGLNQWLGSDKPKREDFCQDNLTLDTKLHTHFTDAVAHITQAERNKWNADIIIGSYTGDGASKKTVTLGYQPKLLFVYAQGRGLAEADLTLNTTRLYSCIYTQKGASIGIEVSATGFSVRQTLSPASGAPSFGLNEANRTYCYVALR